MGNLCGCGTGEEESPEVTQITSNGRLKNGYYKDSFDRFGDDFCELILSYLSFEHKIKFECVSKQWQRTIFNRQYNLDIDKCLQFFHRRNHNRSLLSIFKNALKSDERKLEDLRKEEYDKKYSFYEEIDIKFIEWFGYLTKKCKFITSVSLRVERLNDNVIIVDNISKSQSIIKSILYTIAINCEQMTSIQIWIRILYAVPISVWKQFFEKCGQRLKHIKFVKIISFKVVSLLSDSFIGDILRLCPNVIVSPICLNQLIDENNSGLIVTKISEIKLFIKNYRIDYMDIFTERYGNSLKKLIVIFNKSLDEDQCSQYLSRISCSTQLIYTSCWYRTNW